MSNIVYLFAERDELGNIDDPRKWIERLAEISLTSVIYQTKQISIEAKAATSIEQTVALLKRLDKLTLQHRDIAKFIKTTCINNAGNYFLQQSKSVH